LEFWETYKIEEMGNFLMAANETLKKGSYYSGNKASSERSLSALLTNGGDSAATKKNNLCLTQNYYKAVDLFWVFSHRKTQQQ
jgi:hypothetical protein